jgi:hypothetical protein
LIAHRRYARSLGSILPLVKPDRIKNWPKEERPRERLLAEGVEKLTEAEQQA